MRECYEYMVCVYLYAAMQMYPIARKSYYDITVTHTWYTNIVPLSAQHAIVSICQLPLDLYLLIEMMIYSLELMTAAALGL